MKVPLYVITGFLESGKTSFIKEMLEDPNFTENEKSLLLVCEEGEEEYDPAMLEKYHTVMVSISNEEELTSELLKKLQSQYKPERVLVEYNGMWKMSTLLDAVLPKSWFFYQVVSIVDASTFDTYLANMQRDIYGFSLQLGDGDFQSLYGRKPYWPLEADGACYESESGHHLFG